MRTSAFTPVGLFKLSGEKPIAQIIYEAMISSLGGGRDGGPSVEKGTHLEAVIFANALSIARAMKTLARGGNAIDPAGLVELIGAREREYGVVPAPGSSLYTRQQTLIARRLLSLGASYAAIVASLSALLGDDFVAYLPTDVNDAMWYPADINDGGEVVQPLNLVEPERPRKVIQILDPITTGLGAPKVVQYKPRGAIFDRMTSFNDHTLLVGDELVIADESADRLERVTVSALGQDPGLLFFEATFNKPHNVNALATTQSFAAQATTKRFSLVVLMASAIADPEKRRRTHEQMEKQARGVSTWALVGLSGTGPNTIGPFIINESPIGYTPFGVQVLP